MRDGDGKWNILLGWLTLIRCVFKKKGSIIYLNAKSIFLFVALVLWYFDRWYSSNGCFYKALGNFLKFENSPLEVSTSLSSPSWTSHCDTKSISFPTKASIAKEQNMQLDGPGFWPFWNHVYQIPGAHHGEHKCPTPGTEKLNKCPGVLNYLQ